MLIGLNARLSEYFRLTSQHSVMQTRIGGLKATQIGLQTQIAYAGSDKAVEEWARTFGHQALEGDYVIVPIPMSGTQQPISFFPTPQSEPAAKWSIWLELFFSE